MWIVMSMADAVESPGASDAPSCAAHCSNGATAKGGLTHMKCAEGGYQVHCHLGPPLHLPATRLHFIITFLMQSVGTKLADAWN